MTAAAPVPFDREGSLGYQVNYLARLMEHGLRRQIEEFGVVPGQFAQLLALYEQDGLTQRELCERVQIEQPTMANTLQRMERDGLIERVPDPSDGRRALVMLTERARKLENDLTAAAQEVNAKAISGLDHSDVATAMRIISHMIENMEPMGG